MHDLGGLREVGRDAEIGKRQVLDVGVSEEGGESSLHLSAGEQRDDRQSRIEQRAEVLLAADKRLLVTDSAGASRRDDGADARAPDDVDRYTCLFQGPHHAEVGEASCASAAEDQPDPASRQAARETGDIFGFVPSQMKVAVDGPRFQPS